MTILSLRVYKTTAYHYFVKAVMSYDFEDKEASEMIRQACFPSG